MRRGGLRGKENERSMILILPHRIPKFEGIYLLEKPCYGR